ncbi:STAS domain-containing protein [Desulfurispirillum indicum]|uniref:Sulfate transporter/antisigma-factor antagonist STAS n=1 Tax=Desulfurispirillum indicum (strain ATCC BAA-1389 / DSM 22839 / S5) TaxID=653733 RepID=E6W1C8_DESIS|nr:STAS domain-containing protein [Desulfurispirillum indicum]ADU65384.1 Sulfate transporter/antisigma-factor antagonist STAS [Desulfurispirillum indicum S5]UCZ57277.1 STAS domain-containing protein [Desulfurispirillum indicum]
MSSPNQHSVETIDDVVVVTIGEDLNNPRSNMAFNDFLKEVYREHNPRKLLLSFEKVVFIDSSGIKEIILAHRHQQNVKGQLACAQLSTALLDLFKMVRLDKVFKIFPSRGEALEALREMP